MKLIDLLVQELPKRGGWPEGAEYCHLTQYDRHCLTIVFLTGKLAQEIIQQHQVKRWFFLVLATLVIHCMDA